MGVLGSSSSFEERPRAQTPPMSSNLSSASHTSTTSSFPSIIDPPSFAPIHPPITTGTGAFSMPPPGAVTVSSELAAGSLARAGLIEHNHPIPSSSQGYYFSSTSSEPGSSMVSHFPPPLIPSTYEQHIKRVPAAIRHIGSTGEKTIYKKPVLYRVLYPYQPRKPDEIELQYGDVLQVTIVCDDGWFIGTSSMTTKFGTFPGNYVERI